MKLNGKKLGGVFRKVIAFPRDSGDIVFTVQAVHDYSSFEALCPRPVGQTWINPQGERQEDKPSEADLRKWLEKRHAWMTIQSLLGTPGLTYERVRLDNPDTWHEVYAELQEAGLAIAESNKLLDAILTVNGLNDEAIEEARKRFLQSQAAQPRG